MSRFSPPPADCALCPRLVTLRNHCRADHPDWFNAPVPSLGGLDARLLIVGLAPGLRGANRTGRPFTGDAAGGYLFAMLARFGLADGTYHEDGHDDIGLRGVRITNAVRCLPPENKPVAAEVNACRPFLAAEIAAMPHLETILTLGRLAHDATLRCLDVARRDAPFGHAAHRAVLSGHRRLSLVSSYHCSRYNTQTGRLTDAMFAKIFEIITGAPEAGG
ncbi:MAG: uracil-DNA glycosylase [Pseudomonadota bacterium]|nr:uracil-DNA glycosylase [Pseudomonadota bacterium]